MSLSISAISALIVSGAGTASSNGRAGSVRLVLRPFVAAAGAAAVRKGWQRVLAPCISCLRDMAIKRDGFNLSLLKNPSNLGVEKNQLQVALLKNTQRASRR